MKSKVNNYVEKILQILMNALQASETLVTVVIFYTKNRIELIKN